MTGIAGKLPNAKIQRTPEPRESGILLSRRNPETTLIDLTRRYPVGREHMVSNLTGKSG
jgi:hypothetical protein